MRQIALPRHVRIVLKMMKYAYSLKRSNPKRKNQLLMNYPWIPFLLMIVLGGVIGYLLGFLLPPIYEAKAVVTTNIDLKENRPMVTEIMVDSQLNYVGELMYNPKIVDPLLLHEANLGNPMTIENLKSMASIERQLMNTIIKVHSKNPEIAARIATNWAELAFETLMEVKSHVLATTEARKELAFIEACFPSAPDGIKDEPINSTCESFCEGLSYQTALAKLDEATKVLAAEETKTLGLTAYIDVSQFIPASLPQTPASNNQGMMTLSGMIIGIVLGIIFVDIRRLNKIDEN